MLPEDGAENVDRGGGRQIQCLCRKLESAFVPWHVRVPTVEHHQP
jgi:hypothetical protein